VAVDRHLTAVGLAGVVYAHRGWSKDAWKLARKSCLVAESQKAKYQHAKSFHVQGQLAKRLSRPEDDDQIFAAQAEIDRIESAIATAAR